MRARLERLAPAFAALAVAAIVSIAFLARWRFLDSSPYPLGIDGFYYAVQLRSLLHDRQLYYPASPMVFWLMLPGAWALGPIAGAKLGAALGTALAAAPVYAIVRRATGERTVGVLGAALVATSAGSFYLATVVKQGGAATLALLLALPWLSSRDPNGLVFRLRLMAFVPLAICAPAAIAQLTATARRGLQLLLPIAASAALLALVPLRFGAAVSWPNPTFVPGATAVANHTPPDAIIIVNDWQLAFMVKWAADREARTVPPRAIEARPTFRLASPGVLPPTVLRDLEGFEQRLPAHLPRPVRLFPKKPSMILFAEPTWQALIQAASPADRAQLESRARRP